VAGCDCAGASTAIEHVRLLTRFDLAGWLAAVPLGERTGERGRLIPVAVCLHHLTQTLLIRPRVVAAARHCAADTLYVQDEDQGNPGVDPPAHLTARLRCLI
jgi:hypothetical protein